MKVSLDPSPKRKPWVSVLARVCAALLVIVGFGFVAALVFVNRFARPVCVFTPHMKAEMDVEALTAAITACATDNDGRWPKSIDLLVAPDAVGRTYLRGYLRAPLDPWKRAYHYALAENDAGFRVWSFGRDDQPGGTGQDADIDSATLAPRED